MRRSELYGFFLPRQVIAPLLIILWAARGRAWDSNKSYGEDEASDQLPSSHIGRFSFGSRPTRVAGEYSVDTVYPSTQVMSRNASSSSVAEGPKHGDISSIDMTELGLRSSKPPGITNDDL